MSSLTAWNNFLKEGYEILGDDFKDLTSYGQVKDAFARLTNEVIPLLAVEPDLYAFVNGATLKSWREKYESEVNIPHRVGFCEGTTDVLESDAMIMKDERASHARLLHGYILDTLQEESLQFEDMLFDEQEAQVDTGSTSENDVERGEKSVREVLEETKTRLGNVTARDVLNALSVSIDMRFPTLKNRVFKDVPNETLTCALRSLQPEDLCFTVECTSSNVFDTQQMEILDYIRQYDSVDATISFLADTVGFQEETIRSVLIPSGFDKNTGIKNKILNWIRKQEKEEEDPMSKKHYEKHDTLQLEIIELKEKLSDFYPSIYEIYNVLVKRFKHSLHVLAKCASPSKAGRSMGTKKKIIRDMETLLKEAQGTNKKEEVTPMKPQEKSSEGIDYLAFRLAKSLLTQLDTNAINAKIADAHAEREELKRKLERVESNLNQAATIKGLMSKDFLDERDVRFVADYVDSMGK